VKERRAKGPLDRVRAQIVTDYFKKKAHKMSKFCQQIAHFKGWAIEMKKYRYDKKMHKIN
jgi:hypothetical protein